MPPLAEIIAAHEASRPPIQFPVAGLTDKGQAVRVASQLSKTLKVLSVRDARDVIEMLIQIAPEPFTALGDATV